MTLSIETYKKIFVEDSKLLSEADFDKVGTASQQSHRSLEQMLVDRSLISATQLLQLLESFYNVPAIDLRISDIDPAAVRLVDEAFATENGVIAFDADVRSVKIAMVDPSQKDIIENIEAHTGLIVKPYVAREVSIRRATILYDGSVFDLAATLLATDNDDSSSGGEELSRSIIEAALLLEASDVHIEPFETELLIRFRVDGLLRLVATLPTTLRDRLTAALKIAAEMKIDEKRLPQDGRFTVTVKGQEVNVRMSTVPSLWGEKVVLRVLPKDQSQNDLHTIGLLATDIAIIEEHLKRPFGMILVCGPTGSGKTSTLYSFLQEIGRDRIDIVNVSTIEDPIEYTIPRVTQIQTQPEIDLTFANGLRALLRQDPDVIMVGEIRDVETAEFSIRASLVGRLVLSSLHTNDAIGAIPRLLDMGIEPYLISSTLGLVVAQRLARKLCTGCRQSYKPSPDVIKELRELHDFDTVLTRLQSQGIITEKTQIDQIRFYKASGCHQCSDTGYKGRTAVFEILQITDALRADINNRVDASTIHKTAIESGMKTMFQDGVAKILLGTIDLDELFRVVYA